MRVSRQLLLLVGGATIAMHVQDGHLSESNAREAGHSFSGQRRAVDRDKGSAPGITFYYMQRQYGNPDVNIDERLAAVLEDPRIMALRFEKARAEGLAWYLGPSNIAGRIRALAFHPTDPSIVYAGAASGGVFKTTDGGATWFPLTDTAPSVTIGALTIDPSDPDVLYAGTGEPLVSFSRSQALPVFSGIGLLRSSDAGATWERLPWPARQSAVSRILVHPRQGDTLLVATREGLVRSTTRGATWTTTLPGIITDIRFQEGNPGTVFAAVGADDGDGSNGVYRSDAGGRSFSWKKLGVNFPRGDSTGRIVLATSAANPRLLYALVARTLRDNNDFLALMRSSDDGESWERVATNLPVDFPLQQAHFNFCITADPVDPSIVYVGGLEVWRSTNSGAGFSKLTFAGLVVHVDQHVLALQPGTSTLYLGNDGGVYRSTTQGQTWESCDSTLGTVQFYSVAIDRSNRTRIFGGTQDNGTIQIIGSSSVGKVIFPDIDGGAVQVDSVFLFAMMTLSKFPFRSTNNGQTWIPMQDGLQANDRRNWLQPLLLHPRDRMRLYTATQCVYAARDVKNTGVTPSWNPISPDLTTGTRPNESVISTIAIPATMDDWMYIGTGDGKVWRTENLFFPSPQWTDISAGLPNRWITKLAVDPFDHRTVYAAVSGFGSGHVFRSTNAGATWVDYSGDLPDIPVNTLAVVPGAVGVLWAGTDAGLWFTSSGATWRPYGFQIPVPVYDLAFLSGDALVIATHGRGLWAFDPWVAVHPVPDRANGMRMTVFPNPVRAGRNAELRVQLDLADEPVLRVYDAAGRLRLEQHPGMLEEGPRVLTLGTAGLQPGSYIVEGIGRRTRSVIRLCVLR